MDIEKRTHLSVTKERLQKRIIDLSDDYTNCEIDIVEIEGDIEDLSQMSDTKALRKIKVLRMKEKRLRTKLIQLNEQMSDATDELEKISIEMNTIESDQSLNVKGNECNGIDNFTN